MASPTKQFRKRNAILAYLQETKSHPSAEAVFAALKPEIPDLSMGTVYRNLNLFRQQGLVSMVATVNGVERFDGNTADHVHFICTDCGAVSDLEGMRIPQELTTAAERCGGGRVNDCQLSFTGICQECLKKTKTA